ncbi:hypothetical protein DCS_04800 [Drechmeria coniospora]|uniref:Serine/threonine-protein kinase ppk6 n=1 Tax=Drechmeria coniospora TaxID=98403 RepID=A0A151GL05_DRECN|nr:hypothetical protein DCS_04800 [Drechmeria coniospora]KYK57787.1 hypothetical protein DCS_04800 [Drechmeria coniospora]
MSADLFAEFNSLSDPPPRPVQGQTHAQPYPQPQKPAAAADGDEDGWGDFVIAGATGLPVTTAAAPLPANFESQHAPMSKSITGQPTAAFMTDAFVDSAESNPLHSSSSWSQPQAKAKLNTQVQATPTRAPNVLFDADDFELPAGSDCPSEDDKDDDFGEFEVVPPPPSKLQTDLGPMLNSDLPSAMSLLDFDEPLSPSREPNRGKPWEKATGSSVFVSSPSNPTPAPNPSSLQTQTCLLDVADAASKSPGAHANSKADLAAASWSSDAAWHEAQMTKHDDDDWAAWDDMPAASVNAKDSNGAADAVEDAVAASDDDKPPPVNVPPPSVILSVFPDLFRSGSALFAPATRQSTSLKQQILSNPKAVQFLQGYVLLGTTAARVMSGRKLRWHRDKLLAKSMTISTAGSKGMKLAGLDKTQSAREDREATDVAAAWRDHVGRLRSAVAIANASVQASIKIPELSEQMTVQTAKLVPTAPKPCVICGLKRDERVARVDHEVEDSFGEWWVEHWGHRACKNFWIEHEPRLRQR